MLLISQRFRKGSYKYTPYKMHSVALPATERDDSFPKRSVRRTIIEFSNPRDLLRLFDRELRDFDSCNAVLVRMSAGYQMVQILRPRKHFLLYEIVKGEIISGGLSFFHKNMSTR